MGKSIKLNTLEHGETAEEFASDASLSEEAYI